MAYYPPPETFAPMRAAFAQQFLSSQLYGKTVTSLHISGRRTGTFTDNTTLHDVVEFLGTGKVLYAPSSSGVALELLSTSANDAAAGTGIQAITVVYLDPTGAQQSASITPNGVTPVSFAGGALIRRVLWMHATAVGSGGVAAGDIVLRKTSSLEPLEQISAGGNMSLSARYTVPLGYSAYVYGWQACASANNQDVRLRATVNKATRALIAGVYNYQCSTLLAQSGVWDNQLGWLRMPALTDIKVSTITATTAGNKLSACFDLVLVQD